MKKIPLISKNEAKRVKSVEREREQEKHFLKGSEYGAKRTPVRSAGEANSRG